MFNGLYQHPEAVDPSADVLLIRPQRIDPVARGRRGLGGHPDVRHEGVKAWVERFDRRGTEPFELFRSEVGQNSFKIQEFSLKKI